MRSSILSLAAVCLGVLNCSAIGAQTSVDVSTSELPVASLGVGPVILDEPGLPVRNPNLVNGLLSPLESQASTGSQPGSARRVAQTSSGAQVSSGNQGSTGTRPPPAAAGICQVGAGGPCNGPNDDGAINNQPNANSMATALTVNVTQLPIESMPPLDQGLPHLSTGIFAPACLDEGPSCNGASLMGANSATRLQSNSASSVDGVSADEQANEDATSVDAPATDASSSSGGDFVNSFDGSAADSSLEQSIYAPADAQLKHLNAASGRHSCTVTVVLTFVALFVASLL